MYIYFDGIIELNKIIELKSSTTADEISVATRYLVQINFTFDLTVKSNKFSGTSRFCIRKDEIKKMCYDLKSMLISSQGHARLSDNDSESYIEFSVDKDGHILIEGKIYSEDENILRFKFLTETVSTFITEFENLLLYVDNEDYEKQYYLKYLQK